MKSNKIMNIIYPELFNSNYIFAYKDFNDELKEIIEKSGYKKEFTRKYRRCLLFLNNLRENCTFQNSFEKLVECEDLYSMRLVGQKNIRIIFVFMEISDKQYSILLYTFQEKDSKRGSSDSYKTAIKIANRRINELKKYVKYF
jgi:hypothetical protein